MSTDSSDFDPRYPSAFQRGFTGGADPAPRAITTPVAGRETPTDANANAPTDDPVPALTDMTVEAIAGVDARESAAGAAVSTAEAGHPLEIVPAPPLRGNPWVTALWIVSAALAIGGLAAQLKAGEYVRSPSNIAEDFAMQYVLAAVAPSLLIVGLAAGIAAIVLHAARWRPRE